MQHTTYDVGASTGPIRMRSKKKSFYRRALRRRPKRCCPRAAGDPPLRPRHQFALRPRSKWIYANLFKRRISTFRKIQGLPKTNRSQRHQRHGVLNTENPGIPCGRAGLPVLNQLMPYLSTSAGPRTVSSRARQLLKTLDSIWRYTTQASPRRTTRQVLQRAPRPQLRTALMVASTTAVPHGRLCRIPVFLRLLGSALEYLAAAANSFSPAMTARGSSGTPQPCAPAMMANARQSVYDALVCCHLRRHVRAEHAPRRQRFQLSRRQSGGHIRAPPGIPLPSGSPPQPGFTTFRYIRPKGSTIAVDQLNALPSRTDYRHSLARAQRHQSFEGKGTRR